MLVGYISLGVAVISLLLGLYNWNQSLLRLRADIRSYHTLNGCWAVESVVSNKSSRPFTILSSTIVGPDNKPIQEVELRKANGFFVYMHDGSNVGTTKNPTSYPVQVSAYGAGELATVLVNKPVGAKLLITTPHKTFTFNINTPAE